MFCIFLNPLEDSSFSDSKIEENPTTAFSGVLISCERFSRNDVFSLSAFSAFSFAFSNSKVLSFIFSSKWSLYSVSSSFLLSASAWAVRRRFFLPVCSIPQVEHWPTYSLVFSWYPACFLRPGYPMFFKSIWTCCSARFSSLSGWSFWSCYRWMYPVAESAIRCKNAWNHGACLEPSCWESYLPCPSAPFQQHCSLAA